MELAPDPPLGATMLAACHLSSLSTLMSVLSISRCSGPFRPTVEDVDRSCFLAAAECAEVRHRPVEANQSQQSLDEPASLWSLAPVEFSWLDPPKRHAKQNIHRQTGLDGAVAVSLLAAAPACRHANPAHHRIEPYHHRATALERFIISRPVPGLVGRGCRSADASQPPRWMHDMNPSRDLFNRVQLECLSLFSRFIANISPATRLRASDEQNASWKGESSC